MGKRCAGRRGIEGGSCRKKSDGTNGEITERVGFCRIGWLGKAVDAEVDADAMTGGIEGGERREGLGKAVDAGVDADAMTGEFGGGKRRDGGTTGGDRFEGKFSSANAFCACSEVGGFDGVLLMCRLFGDLTAEGEMRGIRDKLEVVGGRGGRLEVEAIGACADSELGDEIEGKGGKASGGAEGTDVVRGIGD